jgi:hypothetical protein
MYFVKAQILDAVGGERDQRGACLDAIRGPSTGVNDARFGDARRFGKPPPAAFVGRGFL